MLGHCHAEYDTTLRAFKGWWNGRHSIQSDGDPNLLYANRNDKGRWLNAYNDNPDNRWNDDNGFAFAVLATISFLKADTYRLLVFLLLMLSC